MGMLTLYFLTEKKAVPSKVLDQSTHRVHKKFKYYYRRNILQLFAKFPIIFEEFAKYYRNGDKIKYKNKRKIITSQRSTNQPKKFSSQKISENMTTNSSVLKYIRQSTSLYTQNKTKKRFQNVHKPITVVNNSSIDILRSSITENSIKVGNYTIHFERSILTKFNINFTQQPYSTKTKRKRAKLDKIIEKSSYSDEEMYLRVMLKDALFHGNSRWSG